MKIVIQHKSISQKMYAKKLKTLYTVSVDDNERLAEVACLAEERREGVIRDSLS